MILLEGENLSKFKRLIGIIPTKSFPFALIRIGVKDGEGYVRVTDLDLYKCFIVNVAFKLEDIDISSIDVENVFKLPLTPGLKKSLDKFDSIEFDRGRMIGHSKKKEVGFATLIVNDDDQEGYDFPFSTDEMLQFMLNGMGLDTALTASGTLRMDDVKELVSCLDLLISKKDADLVFNCVADPSGDFTVGIKDDAGNSFKYTISELEVSDKFKVSYDYYFMSLMKMLKDTKLDSFDCLFSNLMMTIAFECDGVKALFAVTTKIS